MTGSYAAPTHVLWQFRTRRYRVSVYAWSPSEFLWSLDDRQCDTKLYASITSLPKPADEFNRIYGSAEFLISDVSPEEMWGRKDLIRRAVRLAVANARNRMVHDLLATIGCSPEQNTTN